MTRTRSDISQVKNLNEERRQATIVGLRRVMERGEQLTRDEAPRASGNLKQGISSDVRVTKRLLRERSTRPPKSQRMRERNAAPAEW